MADPQLQKATEAGAQQQQQQGAQQKKEVTELLQKFGGFSAIKGIIFIMGWMVIICCVGIILAAPKDEPQKAAETASETEGE